MINDLVGEPSDVNGLSRVLVDLLSPSAASVASGQVNQFARIPCECDNGPSDKIGQRAAAISRG
jgi:hypothetical protein